MNQSDPIEISRKTGTLKSRKTKTATASPNATNTKETLLPDAVSLLNLHKAQMAENVIGERIQSALKPNMGITTDKMFNLCLSATYLETIELSLQDDTG